MIRFFNKKNRRSAKKPSPAFWILLVVLLFLFVSAFFTGNTSLQNMYSLHNKKLQLEQEKQQLEQQKQALELEIKKLQSDLEYIERVAREQYNLKREDEDIYEIRVE